MSNNNGKRGAMKNGKDGAFTKYLVETKNKINGEFTTLKWLQYIDNDSILMLHFAMDNFDESTPIEDVDEVESMDVIRLADCLAIKEMKHIDFPIIDLSILLTNLKNLVTLEMMNRKGLVVIEGSGKITDVNTNFILTEDGVKTQSLIKKYC
jgi:hypothetical protein